MDWNEFAEWGAKISTWGKNYHETIRDLPVRAQTKPGEIASQLPSNPPESGESMDNIMADFEKVVMPGITHWQHPGFFAYFPSNATPPTVLADFLTSTIAPQCMLWQTSPAATEMETVMMDWLRQSIGLPDGYQGVIQDSASSATLAATLTIRERALEWQGNQQGLTGMPRIRVYASAEVHTSVDRAIWVSGIGQENLVRIPTKGPMRAMDPQALENAILEDKEAGYLPAGLIACTGATGVGACDDLREVLPIAKKYGLYSHVDAAWAGAAMICPEFRALWEGVEEADSIVFNPHKWLGVQFDCSAHFLKDPEPLVKTLAIQPEYLKTHGHDGLINYSEWSVPLGRRFRALKIWFLLRSYGLDELRNRIRNHVKWSQALAAKMASEPDFELVTEPILSLFSFRVAGMDDAAQIEFVNRLNDDGRIYITQTKVDGRSAIRFQAGQFDCTEQDVLGSLDVMKDILKGMS